MEVDHRLRVGWLSGKWSGRAGDGEIFKMLWREKLQSVG